MGGVPEEEEYSKSIIKYLEGNGISWICWVFDPDWYPRLIESFDTFKLTKGGEFFQQALRRNFKQPDSVENK